MRICLVNLGALPALAEQYKYARVGGEEVQHAQLAVALKKLGHVVRLVVADHGQSDGAVYEGVATLMAFKESAGLPILRFIHPRWTKLWSAIGRADADVYYVSCASMILGLLAMFCRLHKRRLVFRVASDYDCEPDKLLIRYRRDRWLYEYGLKRADAILVQTVSQQRALLNNYGRKGTVAGMLVSPPLQSAAARPKDVDVLWVANIRQVKRPERLLTLARSMPDLCFHMAGGPFPEENGLYSRIESEARLIPNLTFHGAVPYLDIGKLFDRAKVFANTSDLEGFPNTFLQAWVRGIPVVTMFDPDGVVRSAGLGSAHSTVADMTQGLQAILRSEGAYQAASSAAHEFMEQRFGERMVLGPYLDAFSGVNGASDALGHLAPTTTPTQMNRLDGR